MTNKDPEYQRKRAVEMLDEAEAVTARMAKYEPIPVSVFAREEGLPERTAHRMINLAKLPPKVKQLIRSGEVPALAAERLGNSTRLTEDQKVRLAHIIAEGRLPRSPKEVGKFISAFEHWAPSTQMEFLSSPDMDLEEARERDRQTAREYRVEQANHRAVRQSWDALVNSGGQRLLQQTRDFRIALIAIKDELPDYPDGVRDTVMRSLLDLGGTISEIADALGYAPPRRPTRVSTVDGAVAHPAGANLPALRVIDG